MKKQAAHPNLVHLLVADTEKVLPDCVHSPASPNLSRVRRGFEFELFSLGIVSVLPLHRKIVKTWESRKEGIKGQGVKCELVLGMTKNSWELSGAVNAHLSAQCVTPGEAAVKLGCWSRQDALRMGSRK